MLLGAPTPDRLLAGPLKGLAVEVECGTNNGLASNKRHHIVHDASLCLSSLGSTCRGLCSFMQGNFEGFSHDIPE